MKEIAHGQAMSVAPAIREVTEATDAELHQLADVLIDCVAAGASVSFMHPLAADTALAFWRRVLADAACGARSLLVVEDETGIVGTVQLVLEQPENQPHRADLAKMLVHPRARRRGLGAALMRAAEQAARHAGKSLLVLDTANDEAARLYASLGWIEAGTIPDYALWPTGGFCPTTFFWRRLD